MANINWLWLIGGIIVGIAAAIATITLIEGIFFHNGFSPPPGIDVNDPDDLARFMEVITVGAQMIVLFAWFAGSTIGGIIAMAIARHRVAPWTVAAFVLAGVLFTFFTFTHPWWMMLGGVALPILAALLVVRRMRGDSAPS